LLQAKRLYSSSKEGNYSLDDKFKAFEFDQLRKLAQIEERFSDLHRGPDRHPCRGLCHYLFYCPRPQAYDERSREDIYRYLNPGTNIFDYARGWHLYEFASDPARHVPGIIASDLYWLVEYGHGPSAGRCKGYTPADCPGRV